MKWEYKSITYRDSSSFGKSSTEAELEAQMTRLGTEGWELAAALQPPTGGSASLLIFKRPKAE
jgi:hypothetical protein